MAGLMKPRIANTAFTDRFAVYPLTRTNVASGIATENCATTPPQAMKELSNSDRGDSKRHLPCRGKSSIARTVHPRRVAIHW